MEKAFKMDEDGDLCCAKCGAQVRQMVIQTQVAIGLEHAQDNEFECVDWDYTNTKLVCLCGAVIPEEAYEWVYEDWWVLRINQQAILQAAEPTAEEIEEYEEL